MNVFLELIWNPLHQIALNLANIFPGSDSSSIRNPE